MRSLETVSMWKQNFIFRANEPTPLKESEQELFDETDPAIDSAGLQLEKFLSVWIQGEGSDDRPSAYSSLYVRTATLDFQKRVGFLQPLQGRSHQIKTLLTPGKPRIHTFGSCLTSNDRWLRHAQIRVLPALRFTPVVSACPGAPSGCGL